MYGLLKSALCSKNPGVPLGKPVEQGRIPIPLIGKGQPSTFRLNLSAGEVNAYMLH